MFAGPFAGPFVGPFAVVGVFVPGLGVIKTSLLGIKESSVLTGTFTDEDIPTPEGGELGVEAGVADGEVAVGAGVGALDCGVAPGLAAGVGLVPAEPGVAGDPEVPALAVVASVEGGEVASVGAADAAAVACAPLGGVPALAVGGFLPDTKSCKF